MCNYDYELFQRNPMLQYMLLVLAEKYEVKMLTLGLCLVHYLITSKNKLMFLT